MNTVTFEELLSNYHFWKNGKRDASKMDLFDLVQSYLFETEFVVAAIYALRLCLQESQKSAIPFANMESSNFVKFLTVEELLTLCEIVSDQKTKECYKLIRRLKDESK